MRKTSLFSLILVLALQTTAQTPNAGTLKTADRKFADAPSDANHATLDATLKWLKQRLSEDSLSQMRPGLMPLRFDPVDFSGCRIKYRYTVAYGQLPDTPLRDLESPPAPTPPNPNEYAAPPSEHRFDLADLNPDSVIFRSLKDSAVVSFTTRSRERKISVVTFNQQPYGRDFTAQVEYGDFKLKKGEAAPHVRDALVHAIKLCQAQP